jgi:tetratricopeptide (TPR) repeat protein
MSQLLRTLLQLPYDEIPDLDNPPVISNELTEVIGLAATKAAEAAAKAAAIEARRRESGHKYSWDRDSDHQYSWDRAESDADKRWDHYVDTHNLRPAHLITSGGSGRRGGLILTASIVIVVILYVGTGSIKLFNSFTAYRKAAAAVEAVKKSIPPTPTEKAYNSGLDFFNGALYDEAIESFDKAIKLDPISEKSFFARAATYQMLKKYRPAMADYAKAISLAPQDWRPYFYHGICNWYYGYLDRALADFDKVEELSKNSDFAQLNPNQQWTIHRFRMDRNQRPWESEMKVTL